VSSSESFNPDFAKGGGMIPAVAQCHRTGRVLMLAYMNEEAWKETLATGRAVYYSRSRNRLWRKGEESGHFQQVHAIQLDCDRDTILLQVEQVGGAACHEGFPSCFFRKRQPDGSIMIVEERVFDPSKVYRV
jgi:phosphoribosyl-AMP cyclohydrolase